MESKHQLSRPKQLIVLLGMLILFSLISHLKLVRQTTLLSVTILTSHLNVQIDGNENAPRERTWGFNHVLLLVCAHTRWLHIHNPFSVISGG